MCGWLLPASIPVECPSINNFMSINSIVQIVLYKQLHKLLITYMRLDASQLLEKATYIIIIRSATFCYKCKAATSARHCILLTQYFIIFIIAIEQLTTCESLTQTLVLVKRKRNLETKISLILTHVQTVLSLQGKATSRK